MQHPTESLRADDASQAILAALKDQLGPQTFNAWFRHGTSLDVTEHDVRVSVPNTFVAHWIETHYLGELNQIVATQFDRELPVAVTVDPALAGELGKNDLDTQADMVTRATEGRTRPRRKPVATQLKHKLDDFIVGACNRLAYSAAVAVAKQDKTIFNPLFLHGPCGSGKTHLLQGICNALARQTNGKVRRWRYVTGEQFTNDYIHAIRRKDFVDFRAKYRNVDLLVIDDIHFLAAKSATQEEFLHTFNAIESAGKTVVLASDTHPNLISNFTPQLQSRFLAGMVVKLDAPDVETRLAILQAKAAAIQLPAPKDVLDYIATHIRSSVRELEGSLIKLAAVNSLEAGPITMDLARSVLADYLARTDSALTLGDIESVVGAYFGVTPADLHSSRRTQTVSLARMITMYLARSQTTMSFPEIGQAMGKNHSSVVLATQRMEKALAENAPLKWTTPVGKKSLPARDLIELIRNQVN